MKALISRCNYRILRSRTITPNLWTFLQIRASLSRVEPGKINPLWIVTEVSQDNSRGPRLNVRQVAANLILVLLAPPLRLLDALGLGDSLMLELVRVEER